MGMPPDFITDDSAKKALAISKRIYGSSVRSNGAQAQLFLRSPMELIANGDGFCGDTTGWAAYDDGAVAKPLDGTGGAPSTLTLAVSTVAGEILVGKSVLKLSKSAANGQGEGQAFTFSIDAARPSSVHEIDLWYAYSANFLINGGTPASPSDIIFYLYDVTSGALIEPLGYVLDGSGHQKMYFQSVKGSTSYRLIAHVATTNANAYDFFFSVSVKPAQQISQPIITDWQSYTPTGLWVSNTTYTGKWRRVGDTMEVQFDATLSGAPTADAFTVDIPSGHLIDLSKIVGLNDQASNGSGFASQAGVRRFPIVARLNNQTQVRWVSAETTGAATSSVDEDSPFTFAAGDNVTGAFSVPIVGWGVAGLGTSADLKEYTAIYSASAATLTNSIPNTSSPTIFDCPNKVYDPHGLVTTGSNWRYKTKVAGRYTVKSLITLQSYAWTVNDYFFTDVYVNGTFVRSIQWLGMHNTWTGQTSAGGSTDIDCLAGDEIAVCHLSSRTGGTITDIEAVAGRNYISISKVGGSSSVIPLDSVLARYTTAAGQSIPDSTPTIVDFGTSHTDTKNITVTTGASWKATALIAGNYPVTAKATLANATTFAAGEQFYIKIRKNGTDFSRKIFTFSGSPGGAEFGIEISDVVPMVANDYVDVQVFQSSGGALSLLTSDIDNNIAITKQV